MAVAVAPEFITVGHIERRHKIPAWQVRRLADAGALPGVVRAGQYRVWPPNAWPQIEAALRELGLLGEEIAKG